MRSGSYAARQEYSIPGISPPISHYTDAVRFGNLLFLSGMVSCDAQGHVVSADDVVGQTRQIHRLIKTILDTVGADFGDVLRVTVYLTDVNDRVKINPVRQEFFGSARPASTLIGVAALALPDLKVEIDAIVGLRGFAGQSLGEGS